jgi:hypothetical protein
MAEKSRQEMAKLLLHAEVISFPPYIRWEVVVGGLVLDPQAAVGGGGGGGGVTRRPPSELRN